MAYDGINYYVTNKGNGTVSKLDSSSTHSTIITGLTSPNDIFFGAVAGNSVILIIDNNAIKIYDSTTYASLLTVNITGALEAHDGVFNPNNTNEFFISDRIGNKIIKGSIGAAPFFPVTFSTLTSNIAKPAGMIINDQGKLIVVSDTANAKVYEVNLLTGAKTAVLNTTLDNLNDIAQDSEKNYYITCWGNDRLYRYSSTWTQPYVVSTFNNPSGLYANLEDDILGITCTNCQKVEFKFFHLFSPLSDIATCQKDSFYVDFTPSYTGIGTYQSGNKFKIQMSDSNGSFANPTDIGSITTTSPPSSIKAAVPKGQYADSGYLVRIASTSPQVFSYFTKKLKIYAEPKAAFYLGDTISGCINSAIELKAYYQNSYIYSFFPPAGLTVKDSCTFEFLSTIDSTYTYYMQVDDNITGCTNGNQFYIDVRDKLVLDGLAEEFVICEGDKIAIGRDKIPYIFNWSGSSHLSNTSASNPIFSGPSSVSLRVSFSDSVGSCFGSDSINILVNEPVDYDLADSLAMCIDDTVAIGISNKPYQFMWQGSLDLTTLEGSNPLYFGAKSATLYTTISDSDYVCTATDSIYVKVNPKPIVIFTLQELEFCIGDTIFRDYTWGDSISFRYINSFQTPLNSGGWIADSIGRFGYELVYSYVSTGCSDVFGNGYSVNPKDDSVRIVTSPDNLFLTAQVYGSQPSTNINWYINDTILPIPFQGTIHTSRLSNGDSVYAASNRFMRCTSVSNTITWKVLSVDRPFVKFNIYPNPSSGAFTLETKAKIKEIVIADLRGKEVYSGKSSAVEAALADGLYYITVKTDAGTGTQKLVIIH